MSQECPKCGYEGSASAVDDLKNATAGAATGAAAGSLIPIVGTAIGASIGGFLGLFAGSRLYECKRCHHQWKG
ncbi:hypothetical protein CEP48_08120 [Mergibacter septicus]|uniref:Uncharacterized protein n=1 Tax=Mergibacter septicus TaxID=221402 RepID=A0A8D4IZ28_9PAST|nr:hypothetical protein [Mergibacter septicus]AWX16134.1 hypothetical protein CEP47_08120 [Mergibacter septicus]QDJ15387.1 hypothetical protein CEP48_08120 [Mergibacter septicus]UTU48743.1 hypothetical protein HLL31_08315 [Mergibacter septicus]WMR95625.1 hypothetical protein RDJ12_06700 [Mergibacter septicus]